MKKAICYVRLVAVGRFDTKAAEIGLKELGTFKK
jgi:hypothetical protein